MYADAVVASGTDGHQNLNTGEKMIRESRSPHPPMDTCKLIFGALQTSLETSVFTTTALFHIGCAVCDCAALSPVPVCTVCQMNDLSRGGRGTKLSISRRNNFLCVQGERCPLKKDCIRETCNYKSGQDVPWEQCYNRAVGGD